MQNANRVRLLHGIVIAGGLMLCAPDAASGQIRDGAPPRERAAMIVGRVVAAAGGPVSGASVWVRSQRGGVKGRPVVTDQDGRFVLENLEASVYTVHAARDGYVSAAFGQRRGSGVPRPVSLVAASRASDVEIRLYRGGVITGVVIDHSGSGSPSVRIEAYRRMSINGQLRVVRAGALARTDDRGEFRLHGLPPDNYYVLATPPVAGIEQRSARGISGDMQTYFPNSARIAGAEPVKVDVETVQTVTIALEWGRAYTIRGYVPAFGERESRAVALTIRPLDGLSAVASRAISISRDGEFTVRGVAPGRYLLQTQNATMPEVGDRMMAATVDVLADDVDGVVLQTVEMIEVRGRVILDGGAGRSHPRIRVGAGPVDLVAPTGRNGVGDVGDDLKFAFRTWTGLNMIRVTTSDPEWQVAAIATGDGRDVTDSGVELRGGGSPVELTVELTARLPQLSGVVRASAAEESVECFIVVFARDEAKWDSRSGRHVAITRPDQEGQYVIQGLPPGRYHVLGVEWLPGVDVPDPGVLRELASMAQEVSLSQGENRRLDLRVNRTVGR